MKIIKTIRIGRSNVEELSSLGCVDMIEWCNDCTLTVHIKPSTTKGRLTARTGEFLCQFESGLWQRFGSEALGKTICKPRKEAEW